MTFIDESFLRRLRETFNMEAEEHLREMSNQLMKLEKHLSEPDRQAAVEIIFRETHSLKGAARSVNLNNIETICQHLENVLTAMKQPDYHPPQGLLDTLTRTIDTIDQLLFHPETMGSTDGTLQLLQKLDQYSKKKESVKKGGDDSQPEVIDPVATGSQFVDSRAPEREEAGNQPREAAREDVVSQSSRVLDDDEIFLEELRRTFVVDGEEHLHRISEGLLTLENETDPRILNETIETIFREAHSLKGAAASVQMDEVAGICQEIETLFAGMKEGGLSLSPDVLDVLHHAVDMLTHLVEAAGERTPGPGERQIGAIFARLKAIQPADSKESRDPNSTTSSKESPGNHNASIKKQPLPGSPSPASSPPKQKIPRISRTVRISLDRLDSLLFQAEELLSAKLTTEQRIADLREVEEGVNHNRRRWSKVQRDVHHLKRIIQMQAAPGGSGLTEDVKLDKILDYLTWNEEHLNVLSTRIQNILKFLGQDYHLLEGMINNLLDNTKKLLMLPFSTITQLFPRVVRDISRTLGKEAILVIQGDDVEVDKRILEEMKDPLVHLLRNSLDHGLELPEERLKLKKPPQGSITISFSQHNAGKVEITIADDGAGIDVEQVKRSAVEKGIISETEAAGMEESEALQLIFQSQVSTSRIVTELSGRGLGMSIVREKVEKLGGEIFVETGLGSGTVFRILLPLTLARFRGILVEARQQQFIIPTANVERVLRYQIEQVKPVGNRDTVSIDGRAISLVHLADVLQIPDESKVAPLPQVFPILLMGKGQGRIAFAVDKILHEHEVVVKRLGKQLIRVRHISGATVLGSGKVVPILNTMDLLSSAAQVSMSTNSFMASVHKREQKRKTILIAEDSITSRTLLSHILEGAGYRVETAVDGAEAFARLKKGKVDLLVSDVEMPRLDGFALTEKIRQDPDYGDLPVVLVTSRSSREDLERGIEVGANAYIVKSNFDQSNLVESIERLI